MVQFAEQNFIDMRRTASGERSGRSNSTWINDMSTTITSYVLCIDDGGYTESLEVRKIYPVLPAREYVRIIDETGEDYLYPMKYFVPLSLSADVIGALTARSIDTNG